MTQETKNPFSDTPEHQEGQTSSIGSIWPPSENSFERIKAFYNLRPVLSERTLCVLQQRFLRETERLDGKRLSRVQFRTLFSESFLKYCSANDFLQSSFEAVIPLERSHAGEKLVLVYLGQNDPARACSPVDLEAIKFNYTEAIGVQPRSVADILERATSNGFSVEVLDKSQNPTQNITQLAALYQRFGWNSDEVAKMYSSPQNIIAVARDKGAIISAGLAEIAQIQFGVEPLTLVEITEAATLEGYGNLGLYTAVSTSLLIALADISHRRTL